MILIDNQPISFANSSLQSQEREILDVLLENPTLLSASNQFKSEQERTISDSGPHMKNVYVFQREFATVDPALVHTVGTDEATTCVGLVIRNRNNGLTSVGHIDFPKVVDQGLNQMVQSINDPEAFLDVYLVGSFDDSPSKKGHRRKTKSENGYSYPLCHKIITALQNRPEKFHLRLLFVLGHNTETDSNGHERPIFSGLSVETRTGQVLPACFENGARSPDEIVRRILVGASSDDLNLRGKLLDIYDTRRDNFTIPCVKWKLFWSEYAFAQSQLSDEEYLLQGSTSPFAEPPHFVECQRRKERYLIEHPDWRYTFPRGEPRVFQRNNDGTWFKCD
ncbi:protein N-terminal asparagine amidohydrolase family protein [Carex rostrata]